MTTRPFLVGAALACSVACGGANAPPPAASTAPAADLIIVNGKVHTMDAAGTIAQAVAVAGNTILKAGTTDEVKALAGPATRVIDAQGHTVTPGFNDEQRKGTLAPGMLADLVVLGSDLASAPIAAPTGVTVMATIVDGKVVFEKR